MSFRSFSCISFIALAAVTSGQTATHPADHSSSGDSAIHLDDYVVTGHPLARDAGEIAAPTSVLAGSELIQRRQPTLGETLSGLPGVDSTWFGPGASRPVIRGLGGDRIRVLSGGVGTLDASVISPDHAVSLEPLLIDRVEIVRGPATLLYGGGAIGGVVNVIDGRIPAEPSAAPLAGRFEFRAGSAANERAGAGVVAGQSGPVAWRLDGFRRQTGDVKTPEGILTNSAVRTSGGAVGIGWFAGSSRFGAAYSGYDSRYGTVAEPDVTIELHQRRWDAQGEWMKPAGLLRVAKFQLGVADYRHDELEGTELGTRFTNRSHEGRLELLHEKIGPFEGALGFQSASSDFAASGEEAFMPPTVTRNQAVFLYQEAVAGRVTWQGGMRLERQTITPAAGSGLARRRASPVTFAAGAVWKLDDDYALAVSLSANERAPNAQELFARGPHVATATYEVGDQLLGLEKSTGLDVGLRKRRGFVTGELSLYVNRFAGYIFEEATGAEEDGLPVLQFAQRDARLCGGEAELAFHLHESKKANADLRFFADTVHATDLTDGQPLPRTTPGRFGAGFDWKHGEWLLTADWRHMQRQNRLAPREIVTPGYDLISIGVTRRFAAGALQGELFLRIANLLDETARVHASFLKDLAPLPGRDFTAGIKMNF